MPPPQQKTPAPLGGRRFSETMPSFRLEVSIPGFAFAKHDSPDPSYQNEHRSQFKWQDLVIVQEITQILDQPRFRVKSGCAVGGDLSAFGPENRDEHHHKQATHNDRRHLGQVRL